MKKSIAITLMAILGLGLFFSQAFAFGTLASLDAKSTEKPGKTPEVETPGVEKNQSGQNNKPDLANSRAGKKYNFKGTVVSYSPVLLVLTEKDDASVTLVLDANTVIKVAGSKDNATTIQMGASVTVQAVKTGDKSYLALRLMVVPGKPQQVHRVGEVTAYAAGKSITVKDSQGSTTFQIAPDVKILPVERAGELKVGARVTIISPRDPSGGTTIAKGIVVHPAP